MSPIFFWAKSRKPAPAFRDHALGSKRRPYVFQPPLLPALCIEVRRIEPFVIGATDRGHSLSMIEYQAVSRFSPFTTRCWRNTPSNCEAEPFGSPLRRFVGIVAFPFVAAIAEVGMHIWRKETVLPSPPASARSAAPNRCCRSRSRRMPGRYASASAARRLCRSPCRSLRRIAGLRLPRPCRAKAENRPASRADSRTDNGSACRHRHR